MATKEVHVAQILTILAGKNGESQVAAVDESVQNEEFEIKKPKDWSKVMTIFVYNPDTKKFEEVDVMHCDVWKENRVGFRYQRESGETPSICDGLGEDESKFIFMIGSGTKPNSFYFEYANGDEIVSRDYYHYQSEPLPHQTISPDHLGSGGYGNVFKAKCVKPPFDMIALKRSNRSQLKVFKQEWAANLRVQNTSQT